MPRDAIRIRGARQNNLKNLSVEIPLNAITVITGVSGSGKSSLAHDTLYAEGQRRYIETFSPYARQFMDRMDRPAVDGIEGIPPAIAIDNRSSVRTSRSTVGTMTEITDYVKLLFTRMGRLHCRQCGRPVVPEGPEDVWKALRSLQEGTEAVITFPFFLKNVGHEKAREELRMIGIDRFFSHGRIRSIDEWEGGSGTLHMVADRVLVSRSERKRIMDSLEQAFRFGEGRIDVWIKGGAHLSFSSRLECPKCGIAYKAPVPSLFSFNSPIGACGTCRGFGRIIDIDPELVIPDRSRSLEQGAVKPWGTERDHRMEYEDLIEFCHQQAIPTNLPFDELTEDQKNAIFDGNEQFYGVRGFFKWLETKTYKMHVRVFLSRYRTYRICPDCHGARFKDEVLLYHLNGLTIADIYALTIEQANSFFGSIRVPPGDSAGTLVLGETKSRLAYLLEVGLGYLTIDRQSRTLSSGELQRVALASALGSSLVNSLYILDEPSIGLHPRDNRRLIEIMKKLRDIQNTVLVVEHDPEIIGESDYMIDLGPGAGERGGELMYFGPTAGANGSITGQYLKGQRHIPLAESRRKPKAGAWLTVEGAAEHNLKDIDVRIPLGLLVCLTGVSGSGKSTLAEEIIYKGIKRAASGSQEIPGRHQAIAGLEGIADVVMVDQKPIGRTPRANPLTYVKAMDPVRRLFAATETAMERGYGPGYFSFNVPGGRCETCKGQGSEKVEMQFLSDVFITCPECGGTRFKKEVLDVACRGKNIHEILSMTVDQALVFFSSQPLIQESLKPLADVGLGYIRIGQPINTLSGGEAQRLKLSRFLRPSHKGAALFILDEPTTGLHLSDIEKLILVLQGIVDQGNTVLVIEHHMDVVKNADWVIDLGPEGGDGGGRVVAAGTPEEIAVHPDSYTGKFLREALRGSGRTKPGGEAKPEAGSAAIRPGMISLTGAREHNLKNLTLSIPRQKLVAFTGVSGSGKSTLAFDILFAEGQRRYLESFAPYARHYVKVLEKPEIDVLSGLPPTVAIRQRIHHGSPKSTVATLTEIYHFLRLLFSKLGSRQCPVCGRQLMAQSKESILDKVRDRYRDRKGTVLVSLVSARKGFYRDLLARALARGYREARIDGRMRGLKEGMSLSRYRDHNIELVMGAIPCPDPEGLVARALSEGNGTFLVVDDHGKEEVFSVKKVCPFCGIAAKELDPRLFSFNSPYGACPACEGMGYRNNLIGDGISPCDVCGGSRLKPEALAVKVKGYSIWDLVQYPAYGLLEILKGLSFTGQEALIADPIIDEILTRLSFMSLLGLSYLSLSRNGDTLSGGEAQRIRLAAQLGSNLTGACYILDEPTIGLHPRDTRMLLDALKRLKEGSNSVLVVEHDEETIREADYIIDLGPGAGTGGGEVVACGTVEEIKKAAQSATGRMLTRHSREIASRLRPYHDSPCIRVRGAMEHNLKQIDVGFPLGALICITGVSGSGKSSLLRDVLFRGLHRRLAGKEDGHGSYSAIEGWEPIQRILEVDHSPIGLTTRSVPISYIGALAPIRTLFSMTPAARARGYRPCRFSFNVAGGRCEACQGHGSIKAEMAFLPDVYIACEVCEGRRFNRETLEITYRGKSIAQVLGLTFEEAVKFFSAVPRIRHALSVVCDIGLGYLTLGQPSPTLSGGEAQRIKIAKELAKPAKGHTFYILDEPTTGLHLADVSTLIRVLQALVDRGNTVAVIEHNMEFIKEADYIIDLGPEGGDKGGYVVAAGSPVEMLANGNKSYTAEYLRRYVNNE